MGLQENTQWYQYLDGCQKELVRVSFSLLDKKNELASLNDFSFIVFPMAKAYEGFLKKVFYDLQLINKETYEGRRFRIGRALNPDVNGYQRDEYWLYDDVERRFGKQLARQLWDTWLDCRNRIFHYFPDCDQFLKFNEATEKIKLMEETMQAVASQILKDRNETV